MTDEEMSNVEIGQTIWSHDATPHVVTVVTPKTLQIFPHFRYSERVMKDRSTSLWFLSELDALIHVRSNLTQGIDSRQAQLSVINNRIEHIQQENY